MGQVRMYVPVKNQSEGIGTSGKQQTDRMGLASRHLVVDANQMTTLLLIHALTNRANTIRRPVTSSACSSILMLLIVILPACSSPCPVWFFFVLCGVLSSRK